MWMQNIDVYYKRIDSAFLSKPLNAIINVAFPMATFIDLNIYKKLNIQSATFVFMAFLVYQMSIGSFSFHTFANNWNEITNTVPLVSFVFFYVIFSIRIIYKTAWFKTI